MILGVCELQISVVLNILHSVSNASLSSPHIFGPKDTLIDYKDLYFDVPADFAAI